MGSEIRRSPVEVGSLSHDFQGFIYIPDGARRISEPSTISLKLTTKTPEFPLAF